MTYHDEPRVTAPELPPAPPAPPPAIAATSATEVRFKAPAGAVVLSFFLPGLGHLYAEAYERGVMIFASMVLVIFATARGALPVALGVLSCIFLWFFGMFDAYRETQLLGLADSAPERSRGRDGEGRLWFGVLLAVVGFLLLVDNLDLFDLEWLLDWWPALVLAVGCYLIGSAAWERRARSGRGWSAGDEEP